MYYVDRCLGSYHGDLEWDGVLSGNKAWEQKKTVTMVTSGGG